MAFEALVALPISLLLSILTARAIGPDALGVYNFAIWVLAAGTAVATNGVTLGMQQFAAEQLGQGDKAGATAVLALGFRWQLALASVLLSVGLALTLALSPPEYRVALIIATISVGPAIFVSVPAAGLGAAQAFAANVVPSVVATVFNFLAAVAALAAGWKLMGLTLALLLSRLVDASLRYLSWRRVWQGLMPERLAHDTAPVSTEGVQRMRRYAWTSSVVLLIDIVVWDRSEFLVLMHYSSLREVAFYSLSFNIVQQALAAPRIFTRGLGANLLVEMGRDRRHVITLSRDGIRYTFAVAAPLTLGLAAIAPAIMPLLYGSRYSDAIPVLAIAAGLAVLRGALEPVRDLLRMSEQQSFLIVCGVTLGVVNIGLDLWLIPSGGAVGAAWANGIAQALAAVVMTVFASRTLGLSVPLADLTRILLACMPMIFVTRWLSDSPFHWLTVGLGVPLGAALYLACLKFLRVMRPTDHVRLASLGQSVPRRLRPAYTRVLAWLTTGA